MCYRCSKCDKVVPPNTPRLVHIIYRSVLVGQGQAGKIKTWAGREELKHTEQLPNQGRTRKEIAQEIPVCAECKARLNRKIHSHTSSAKANGVVQPTRFSRTQTDSL